MLLTLFDKFISPYPLLFYMHPTVQPSDVPNTTKALRAAEELKDLRHVKVVKPIRETHTGTVHMSMEINVGLVPSKALGILSRHGAMLDVLNPKRDGTTATVVAFWR